MNLPSDEKSSPHPIKRATRYLFWSSSGAPHCAQTWAVRRLGRLQDGQLVICFSS